MALATSAGVGTALVIDDAPAVQASTSLDLPDVDLAFEGRTARWVQDENQREGTTDWRLDPGKARGIEVFADAVSGVRGDAVTMFVSTSARRFHVRAYRLGWYGGDGGRLVWVSSSLTGNRQPAPLVESRTGMVEADWTPSLTVRITADFVPGVYLFKVVGSDGEQVHVPFVVRDDSRRHAYLLLDAATARAAASTGRAWSFDRPVDPADVVRDELPVIALAESLGLDVAYAADVDLHRHGVALERHGVAVVLGRDGHWSSGMRRWLQGKSVVLLGPAAPTRDVRFEDSPVGFDRRMVDSGPSLAPPPAGPRVARVDRRDLRAVAGALQAAS